MSAKPKASRGPPESIGTGGSLAAILLLGLAVVLARSIGESSHGLVAVVADVAFYAAAAALYLAPWLVAADRRHPRRKLVALLNVLAGWTLLGWIATLIFAFGPAPGLFADPAGPAIPPPKKRCPGCRRLVNLDDRCRYCGQSGESVAT